MICQRMASSDRMSRATAGAAASAALRAHQGTICSFAFTRGAW